MSHFFTVVLVPPDTEDIEGVVTELLAPYDENLDAPAYREYLDLASVLHMAGYYDLDPERDGIDAFLAKMAAWCGDSGGWDAEHGLYRLSTYNVFSRWDWWVVGGRWDGEIRGKRRGTGFNFGFEHQQLSYNTSTASNLAAGIHNDEVQCPFALVTPDGNWYGERRWFEEQDEWKEQALELLEKHAHCIAVGCDLHI